MKLLRGLRAALSLPARAPAVILMYHRIAIDPLDPWQLCVTPASFAAQLDWLREHARVVPMRQLAAELAAGDLQPRSVAITFDDGYADNLLVAEPLLRERGLPATFFLTTATLGGEREFWWDELEHLLMRPEALPATVRISLNGETRSFEAGRAAAPCDPLLEISGVRPWNAPPDSRLALYYRVWNALRPLEEEVRQGVLLQIRTQLDSPTISEPIRRTLTHDEARELARSAIAEIGAHSVTHAAFSHLTAEQQRWEMNQSRQDLQALVGSAVHGFAYPYGDYSAQSAELAREAGFQYACTTDETSISQRTPIYLLPRLGVEQADQQTLAARLSRILK